jgi:hypothetical protein
MANPQEIRPSPATFTRTQAEALDPDGLKTAFATSASPVTVLPADLNGAQLVAAGAGVIKGPDRRMTIARSNAAGQYSTSPIVLTAKNGRGETVTESQTPANINGNDTITFTTPIREIVSVAFPGQGGVGGSFQIGVVDLVCNTNQPFRAVRAGAANNLAVVFTDGSTDTIPALQGERHDVLVTRLDATNTTAWPVTLYT